MLHFIIKEKSENSEISSSDGAVRKREVNSFASDATTVQFSEKVLQMTETKSLVRVPTFAVNGKT